MTATATATSTTTAFERAGYTLGYGLGYLLVSPVLFACGIGKGLARIFMDLRARVVNRPVIAMSLQPLALQTCTSRSQYVRTLRATRHDPAWEYFTDNELLAEMAERAAAAGWHLQVTDDDVFLTVIAATGEKAALTIDSLPFPGPYRLCYVADDNDDVASDDDPLRDNAKWMEVEEAIRRQRERA